jgi:hypothetical protein
MDGCLPPAAMVLESAAPDWSPQHLQLSKLLQDIAINARRGHLGLCKRLLECFALGDWLVTLDEHLAKWCKRHDREPKRRWGWEEGLLHVQFKRSTKHCWLRLLRHPRAGSFHTFKNSTSCLRLDCLLVPGGFQLVSTVFVLDSFITLALLARFSLSTGLKLLRLRLSNKSQSIAF